MKFTFDMNISAYAVFLQGLLSFFSPCVLPLIPIYMGYLSGGTKTVDANGITYFKRSKVMLNTLFFVLGISFALFTLGFTSTVARSFFGGNRMLFNRLGGVIVILFGLYQLGVFGASQMMGTERRLPFQLDLLAMNPVTALLLGFLFSFAWTPCVGPGLASVLLVASSASSAGAVYFYIGIYTLGFTLPFIATGLFTSSLLAIFKKYKNVVNYTTKIGAALMIFMGVMMFTGWMNNITGYLSQFGNVGGKTIEQQMTSESLPDELAESSELAVETTGQSEPAAEDETEQTETAPSSAEDLLPAPDFTLLDQYGNTHTLSDYKGKVVFLNFWATWCPPCRKEMPDIQEIYEEYGYNENDLIVLGIAGPEIGREGSVAEITAFMKAEGYAYPVVMNEGGDLFVEYGITAYPTTFMIGKDGTVFGYAQGQLTKDLIESIIVQTMEGKRP